jgi:hypothetical protein
MPRKVHDGPATSTAQTTPPEQPVEWASRPLPGSWWQTRQERTVLAERLLTVFTDPDVARRRDQTRRRGLAKVLDWLQLQPGETAGPVADERGGRSRLCLGQAPAG